VFTIAKDGGIHGGALEVKDVLPRNGRIFIPAKGNLAFKKGGWGGAVSFWMKTDPETLLKTKFCDPFQITHKGANNAGIWVDFNYVGLLDEFAVFGRALTAEEAALLKAKPGLLAPLRKK